MERRNLLMLVMLASIVLIVVLASMAFASAHQMNYGNMQVRNSNSMSMHRTNNYMHMNQQNNLMHANYQNNNMNSMSSSRMNSQRNAQMYMYMPNHRHMNADMHRF